MYFLVIPPARVCPRYACRRAGGAMEVFTTVYHKFFWSEKQRKKGGMALLSADDPSFLADIALKRLICQIW